MYNTARAIGEKRRLPVKDGPDFCTLHILPVTNDSASFQTLLRHM